MSEPDRLYKLLPAIYRLQDAKPEQGQALRALMALIEQQFLDIEADVDQLYDDWFIETCQEWLVPYIGDLLGVRSLQSINPQVSSQRAYVANALLYRQRKGTASVLEQLARDVTNWPARSVEFFERLSTTQHLNHLRLGNLRTPDLRDTNALELVDSPFETANHYPEVRRIASRRGRYNISNVGLFLWRLQSYPLMRVTPRPVEGNPGLYWVSPLGLDHPLFNPPNPETAITQLADEINVPTPLRRRPLHDEVEAINAAIADGNPPQTAYFDRTPVFEVIVDGALMPPEDLVICDLSGEPNGSGSSWFQPVSAIASTRRIGIDPVLGRLAIPHDQPLPETLHVSYAYGFSGDIGGGPYDRRDSVDPDFLRRVSWQVGVSRTITPVGSETIFATFAEAIAAWNLQPPDTTGVIVLMDNETYATDMTDAAPILLKESSELLIAAADWPDVAVPDQVSLTERRLGQLSPAERRAHLRGDLLALGEAPPESANPGRLWLNGLLLEGRVVVQPGHLGDLQITHCTLVPRNGGLWVEAATETTNSSLKVTVQQSISGPLYLADTVMSLAVYDSLVDASASGHLLLSAPVVLPIAGEVRVQVGTNAPATLTLNAADFNALRSSLETALQAMLPEAQVARHGDRLMVAGQPGQVLSFTATNSDIETARRLGLDGAPAAIASLDPTQPAPTLTIERSTVFGTIYGEALQLASEVIFTAPVLVQRRQVGCVRFSYVPTGSQVPRRYRCQPDLAIAQQLAAQNSPVPPAIEATIRDRVSRQIVPGFTSARYGDPAYGQLSQICPIEIRTGAEDGSEMGAFSFLKQPQREANLQLALEEYLRFGLEAGIFFVT